MPSGNENIAEQGKQFSKEYQPQNRRKSTKFLTTLLTRDLKKKRDIIIEVEEMIDGRPTGRKVTGKLTMPTKDVIVQALLRQAAKGNVVAIKEIFDRTEGKVVQGITAQVNANVNISDLPINFE